MYRKTCVKGAKQIPTLKREAAMLLLAGGFPHEKAPSEFFNRNIVNSDGNRKPFNKILNSIVRVLTEYRSFPTETTR
jgi:hypothetical protein